MKLVRARIVNFMNIEELTVDFHPTVTALVGRNNAGKSTILRAIDLTLGYFADGGVVQWPSIYNEVVRGGRRGSKVQVSLDVYLSDDLQGRAFSRELLSLLANGTITVRLSASFDDERLDLRFGFASGDKEKLFEAHQSSRFSTGIDDFLTDIGADGIGGIECDLHPIAEHLSSLVILSAGRVSQGEDEARGSRLLANDASNLLRFLITLLARDRAAYHSIIESLHELVPEITDLALPLLEGNVRISAEMRDAAHPDLPIPWAQVSSGTKQILGILSYSLSSPIMLLEEPELSLHPAAIVGLMRTLERMAADRTSQVICTTHSPSLIDSLSSDQVRIITRERDGPTSACNMDSFRNIEDRLRKFGVTLGPLLMTAGGSRANSAPSLLLVLEGRTDRLLWPKILEKSGVDPLRVQLINGDGWQDACAIARFIGFLRRIGVHSLPYYAVFDSDGAPDQRRVDIRSAGLTDDEFTVLDAKELESYLVDAEAIAAVTGQPMADVQRAIVDTKKRGKEAFRSILQLLGITSPDVGIMEAVIQQMTTVPAGLVTIADEIKLRLAPK